jgi:osmotically inducible protein OsmC
MPLPPLPVGATRPQRVAPTTVATRGGIIRGIDTLDWLEDAMATFARHADVEWSGGLMDGSGTARGGSGAFALPVTFPSRVADRADGKTTPEELVAAAHATCYAMVLANTIGKQGGSASRLRVTATVTADKSDAGIKITTSHLQAIVEGLKGIESGSIQELATGAEKGCPISNALRGSVTITVEARTA